MSALCWLKCDNDNLIDECGGKLTLSSNKIVRSTDSPFAGYGSYYLPYGDNITINNSNLKFSASQDFTLECFVKVIRSDAYAIFWSNANNFGFWFKFNNGNILSFQSAFTMSYNITDSTWHHIAFTRKNGTMMGFIDGKLTNSASNSTTFDMTTSYINVSPFSAGNTKNDMYIANFRVSDTCLYDADFDPTKTLDVTHFLLYYNNGYKKFDSSANIFIDVADVDVSTDLETNDFYDLNAIVPYISTLPSDTKIISNKEFYLKINGTYPKSMICTLEPMSMKKFKTIHSITGDYTIENNGVIKLLFSFDKGSTWKTYDVTNSKWNTVSVNIPIKLYENFTDEDKTNWNDATNTILSDGISVQNLGNVDFQSIKTDKLMFAVAFNRPSYADTCTLKGLNINYDGLTTYIQLAVGSDLSKYEAKATITGDTVGVTTSSNQDKILVTMTTNI